jgi:hypothetical protein
LEDCTVEDSAKRKIKTKKAVVKNPRLAPFLSIE